jgi:hypothetical protein
MLLSLRQAKRTAPEKNLLKMFPALISPTQTAFAGIQCTAIRGIRMSESSNRMLLLLQELSLLGGEETNFAEKQKRRDEISREMKELAERKQSETA